MSQSFIAFKAGSLSVQKPPKRALDTGSREWTKSDLDNIATDLFQSAPVIWAPGSLGYKPRQSRRRLNNSQSRLTVQNGLLAIQSPLAPRHDPSPHTSDEINMAVQNCSLLNLPVEIRLCIYRHLLVSSTPAAVLCSVPNGFRVLGPELYDLPFGIFPQILETCKKINREATPLLYSDNTFRRNFYWRNTYSRRGARMHWPLAASSPLSKINFQCISRIRLFREYDLWFRDGGLRILDELPSLKELQVHIDLNDISKEVDLPTLCEDTIRAVHRDRPGLECLRVKIRQQFGQAYKDWCNDCIGKPLSFGLHIIKKAELEEWMKREGLFVGKRLAWSFWTDSSEWCGPSCTIGFAVGGQSSKTDRIECCFDHDGETTFSSLPVDPEEAEASL